MPGYPLSHATNLDEAFQYRDHIADNKESSTGINMIHEDGSRISVVKPAGPVPRLLPPSRPPPPPPVQSIINKSLPTTPVPGYSPPHSTTSTTYSQTITPTGATTLFQPPPTTPPPSTSTYQSLPTRNPHQRRKRSTPYLPLESYPPGPNSTSSSPFSSIALSQKGGYYNTPPPSTPSSTPSLSPSRSPSRSAPSSSPPSLPSSTTSSPSRRRPGRSYPPSAFSPSWSPGYNAFSPVPLSAAPLPTTPGRPEWYRQSQSAQVFTPAQARAQLELESSEAREGSLGGMLALAVARAGGRSPDSTGSRRSSGGWSGEGILPGGGRGGRGSRRGSFSELTGVRDGEEVGEGKGAWGAVLGAVGVAGRWARGRK